MRCPLVGRERSSLVHDSFPLPCQIALHLLRLGKIFLSEVKYLLKRLLIHGDHLLLVFEEFLVDHGLIGHAGALGVVADGLEGSMLRQARWCLRCWLLQVRSHIR